MIKIDTTQISEKINSLLDCYPKDVSNDDFRFFSEDLRTFVLEIAENYISETYNNHYGLLSLDDKLAFGDVCHGYKAQIQEFINNNGLDISYNSIKIDDVKTHIQIPRKSLYVAVGGTIIAVTLCFASKIWIALVAEIIALGLAYKIYSDNRKRAEAITAKRALIDKKQALAEQIEHDVKNWLNELSRESDRVISSFHFDF